MILQTVPIFSRREYVHVAFMEQMLCFLQLSIKIIHRQEEGKKNKIRPKKADALREMSRGVPLKFDIFLM